MKKSARGGLAALGVAAFAVVCCAALPLLVVLAGSAAIGTVAGVGAGVVAGGAMAAAIVWRVRSRRPPERTGSAADGS